MSGQFVGLAVRLFLKNQSVIEGRVLAIDDETQLITLENATIKANGSSRTISTHHVPGQEIADLHILKAGDQKATPTSSPANPAPPVNLAPPTFAPVQNYHAHPQMNPHPVPSMAIPGNHAPPLQPHPQGNLPSPAPGQLPMPPSGLMHHHHQMHPMPGHYHPGAMPITQQQLFGMGGMGMMSSGPQRPPMMHHISGTPLPNLPGPSYNAAMGFQQAVPADRTPMDVHAPQHQPGFQHHSHQPPPQPVFQQQHQQQPQPRPPAQKQAASPTLLNDPAIISLSMSKPPPSAGNQIPSVLNAERVPIPPPLSAYSNASADRRPQQNNNQQQGLQNQQQKSQQGSSQQQRLPQSSQAQKQKPPASTQQDPKPPLFSNVVPVKPVSRPTQPVKNPAGPFLAPPHLSVAPESATEEEEIDFAEFTAQTLNLTPTIQAGVTRNRRDSARGRPSPAVVANVPVLEVVRKTGSTSSSATVRNDGGRGQRAAVAAPAGKAAQAPQVVVTKAKAPKVVRRHEAQSPTRRRRKDKNNAWANEDAEDIQEDFDIQGSLRLFDKSTVFSEIRESDMTDPETLLVSHNRLKPATTATVGSSVPASVTNGSTSSPSSSVATPPLSGYYHHYIPSQPKLGIREPVLDIAPSGDETGNDAEVESELESDGAAAFEAGDEYFELTPIATDAAGAGTSLMTSRKRPKFVSAIGVAVPSVTPAEMVELERSAVAETGPNEEQMIENGGRGVAMMVLQLLGGGRRIKPGNQNSAPIVVVLAGNNKTGAYALCAARHLANHEVNVMVCAVGNEAEQSNTVAYQRKIYLPTGGQIVRGIPELPLPTVTPVDLIIDALLGPHQTILDLPSENDRLFVSDLMKWANDNRANVMSLDVPSGISGLTGQPTSPSHYVNAKWTVALGLPKTGLMTRELSGELFLADIGIPKIVFQKFGRVGPGGSGLAAAVGMARIKYVPPFGEKFLIALTYAETEEDGGLQG